MPELRTIANIEGLLVTYLKADAAVAALVATRVSTELPKTFAKQNRIQLFRIGGVPDADDVPGHLDRPSLQFNAFGATRAGAFSVAAELIRAVLAAPKATFSGAVITSATRVLGPTWSPDPGTDPDPVPRYIVGMVLSVHPTGS